ncbi:class I SAM-dependent methyltransferase [Candidatus Microgenomates bacterium]|nr:class I SAM-dependent methyltransferase [Candidatus Microgenomates bacterium]
MSTLKLFKKDFYQRIGGLAEFDGKMVLDIGCGDGEDAKEIARYASNVVGLDITIHPNWKKNSHRVENLKFLKGDAEKLPFKSSQFTGIFLKDVLHHVNNPERVLKEIKRVSAPKAIIILIEGNRYNPLFYIHMTKIGGHEHLPQSKFKGLILKYFSDTNFINFESHFVPFINVPIFKAIIFLEKLFDKLHFLRYFLSYNCAIIYNDKV